MLLNLSCSIYTNGESPCVDLTSSTFLFHTSPMNISAWLKACQRESCMKCEVNPGVWYTSETLPSWSFSSLLFGVHCTDVTSLTSYNGSKCFVVTKPRFPPRILDTISCPSRKAAVSTWVLSIPYLFTKHSGYFRPSVMLPVGFDTLFGNHLKTYRSLN